MPRLFVHTHHRKPSVIRLRVRLQHVFHACDQCAVGFRGDDPGLNLARRHAIFFRVFLSVSWLTVSTMASSTTCSATNRHDQLAHPLGGLPRRNAMTGASCSPSSRFWGGGLRFFAVQRDLKANSHEALPDVFSRFRPTQKGFRNFFLCPVGAIGIGLEEHVRSPHLLRRTLQLFNHTAQRFSFLVCQANHIFFFPGNPPGFSPVSLMGPMEGTLIFKIDRALGGLFECQAAFFAVEPKQP